MLSSVRMRAMARARRVVSPSAHPAAGSPLHDAYLERGRRQPPIDDRSLVPDPERVREMFTGYTR